MKTKKLIFSVVALSFAIILLASGFCIRKKPIDMNKMAGAAEIIEYEDDGKEMVDSEEEASICVYGNSKITVAPDSAKICAKIETLNADMSASKQENFASYEKVIESLSSNGFDRDDITFDNFYCHPNFNYEGGREILGYCATTRFCVCVKELDKIKDCVSLLSENGVTTICDIAYQVSNMSEEYTEALMQAITNAKEKASKLLGRDDLKMISLKEQYVYSCNDYFRGYADISADYVGKIEIEAQVLAEFR